MGKKSIFILASALLALVIGIMARKIDVTEKDTVYTFQVNGYKMVRSSNRSERTNEKAFIQKHLFSNPKDVALYPLTQSLGQPFVNAQGKHIEPNEIDDIVPRVDLVHSKGAVKDFYKLTYNPALNAEPSTVVCLPRSKANDIPSGNFKYKFTTKAENTIYGTMTYSCYVTPDNDFIKTLFEITLPGTLDDNKIKTIGQ